MPDLPSPPPLPLVLLADQVDQLAANQWTESTRDRYGSAWRAFVGWCRHRAMRAMPAEPDTVALYLADRCTDVSISTLNTELAAINHAHGIAGEDSPTGHPKVRAVLRGIRRKLGIPPNRKQAIGLSELGAMVAQLPQTKRGARDRALLCIGWASALRRSELSALQLSHVSEVSEGLRLAVPRSKTDQAGAGALVGVPYATVHPDVCPVLAYRAWLQWSGIDRGRLFRSINQHGQLGHALTARSVSRIVKRAAVSIGLNPDHIGAHSLRSGLATECGRAGVAERHIARQTRHRSIRVLRGYIQDGTLWTEHPLQGVL